jgi:hypothetical protein
LKHHPELVWHPPMFDYLSVLEADYVDHIDSYLASRGRIIHERAQVRAKRYEPRPHFVSNGGNIFHTHFEVREPHPQSPDHLLGSLGAVRVAPLTLFHADRNDLVNDREISLVETLFDQLQQHGLVPILLANLSHVSNEVRPRLKRPRTPTPHSGQP